MPNPNYSETKLSIKYGPNADEFLSTEILESTNDDCDEPEQKYIENVGFDPFGRWVPLNHYATVISVTIQNITFHQTAAHVRGWCTYVDSNTLFTVITHIPDSEEIQIHVPDVGAGIWLYSDEDQKICSYHLVIIGKK